MASWAEQLERELSGRGLAIAFVPGKGRGLVATRSFFPGEVLICQEPYASAPNKVSVGSTCDHCFSSGKLRKCSVCRLAWYCGSVCQKAEWKLHQLECQAISALTEDRKKMLTPTIRLMVRLILRRKLQIEKAIPSSATDNYNLVDVLESHISKVDGKQLVLYAQMANLVQLVLPSIQLDLKEIAHTFSKFACNAHTICDPELRPLGTGLFPVISIINHSCVPNAVLLFEGQTAYVRALEPLSNNTEISISYIETAATTMKRQNDLKQYFFSCSCPCCIKDSEEDALLEGYRCKDTKCDGILLPDSGKKAYTCQKCGICRDGEEVKKVSSQILLLSDKASSLLSSGNNSDAGSVYKVIEQLEQKLYHSFSIPSLHTREKLLKICMDLQDWQTSLMYCRLTIPVYERHNSNSNIIKPTCSCWSAAMDQVADNPPSGCVPEDYPKYAQARYKDMAGSKNKEFQFQHCFSILQHLAKWKLRDNEPKCKKEALLTMDDEAEDMSARNAGKPEGNKKAKERVKVEGEAASFREKLDQLMKSKEALTMKTLETKLLITEKKKEVKLAKVEARREDAKLKAELDLRMIALKEAKAMKELLAEERDIMMMRTDGMDEDQLAWWKETKADIMARKKAAREARAASAQGESPASGGAAGDGLVDG